MCCCQILAAPPLSRRPLLAYDALVLASSMAAGSPVSTWHSTGTLPTALLGGGFATSGNTPMPILETDAQSSLPHVALNRNGNTSYVWLHFAAPLELAADTMAPGLTLFIVARLYSTVDESLQGGINETLLSCSSANGTRMLLLARSGISNALLYEHYSGNAATRSVITISDMASGSFEVYTLRVSAQEVVIRRGNIASLLRSGATTRQLSLPLPSTLASCRLGALAGAGTAENLSGALREVQVYGSALSNAQLDTVYEELRIKWRMPRLTGERLMLMLTM